MRGFLAGLSASRRLRMARCCSPTMETARFGECLTLVRGGRSCRTPEVLELGRRQFGIPDRVLDRFVTKVVLNATRIVACIGQRVAAGMAQHINVDREAEELLAVA